MTEISRHPPVTACVGDQVSLDAPREGVGGYRWEVELDPQFARVHAKELVPGSEFGSGAIAHFTIEIVGAGESVARLRLKRPWEKEAAELVEYPLVCGR